MGIRKTSDYEALSIEEALRILSTSENGLSESQAKQRIGEYGENALPEERRNPLLEFLTGFWGPMPWLLELTMALSIFLQRYIEALIILVLLIINVTLGFRHTQGSRKALELLRRRLAVRVRVLRDGEWVQRDSRDIVPGDIFLLGLGDIVPADAKVIEGEVSVDQSALTGESLPISKVTAETLYSSSTVRRGKAKCVAVNTGVNTYFGKTAGLVKIAKPKSHQEEIMTAIIKQMLLLGLIALVIVAGYALLTGAGLFSILILATIILMGAVPVALPTVMAIVQAVGAMQLVKKGVLVTRLDSVEDAASVDVLCLDKTGTITRNELSVVDIVPFNGFTPEEVVTLAALASSSDSKDLMDIAVIDYAKTLQLNFNSYQQVSFTPFEPSTKRTEALVQEGGSRFRVVKGASQTVLSMCDQVSSQSERVTGLVEELSKKGCRTLAVARSNQDNTDSLHLTGLVALADPIRPDSKRMIEEVKSMGVKPLMLTGDNISIAKEIAAQASVGNMIIPAKSLEDASGADRVRLIEECNGFAEIYPEDKFRIVKLLQLQGHLVGMTGDGVNDAPALRQAEMGIAVSNATDVAKASASMVLTDPGLRVIVDAIRTSRQIYQRMLSWVINKVVKVLQFIGLLTLGFFWLHSVVISLLGMVLLVFANDFVTISLATDNVQSTGSPNTWNVKDITLASLALGASLILEGGITLFIGTTYFQLNLQSLQTLVLLNLVFASQFRVYLVRERRHFWSSMPGKGLIISTAAATGVFATLGVLGVVVPPLEAYQVLFILVFSALFTLGLDPLKTYTFKRYSL